jgi:hypothetical protein
LAHVVMHEVRSDAALFLARPLIAVPEYVVSFSTAKATLAMEVGDPEADVALVVPQALVTLDEEALLELTRLLAELDELETLAELELELPTIVEELTGIATFWYMFNPEGPPQIWVELPAQTILHRPSDIGLDPAWIVFPQ